MRWFFFHTIHTSTGSITSVSYGGGPWDSPPPPPPSPTQHIPESVHSSLTH